MVLAARGTVVTEAELEQCVRREEGGTGLEELGRLARSFGLVASVQEATVEQIRALLQLDADIIAYINRRVFALRALTDLAPALHSRRIHGAVPTRVTARHITIHDPLLPAVVTKTIRRFEAAQRHLGSACLVLPAGLVQPGEIVAE
jgi:hypothetical protein